MKNFEFSTPRIALGLAAVAMTAITLGGLVVLPAQIDSLSPDYFVLTAAEAATRASSMAPGGSVSVDRPYAATSERRVDPRCPAPDARATSDRQRKFSAAG